MFEHRSLRYIIFGFDFCTYLDVEGLLLGGKGNSVFIGLRLSAFICLVVTIKANEFK